MVAVHADSTLIPNKEFTKLASDAQIERIAKALEANGMHTLIAENGAEAKKIVLGLVPENAKFIPINRKRSRNWVCSMSLTSRIVTTRCVRK